MTASFASGEPVLEVIAFSQFVIVTVTYCFVFEQHLADMQDTLCERIQPTNTADMTD